MKAVALQKPMSWLSRARRLSPVLLPVLLLLPWILPDDYLLHVAIFFALYGVLALSLNIVTGMTGQLSLAHASFYGIGAYTAGLLMLTRGVSFWLAILAATALTGVAGLLLGMPCLRVRGHYLAMVTLGFCEITHLVMLNWTQVTRGPMGLPGIPRPEILGQAFVSKAWFYYLILLMLGIAWIVFRRIEVSPLGLSLLAIREDEMAAESVGVDTTRAKLTAFTLSSALAGSAGAFFASYLAFVHPDSFRIMESATILSMIVLGGFGSAGGAILGAAILIGVPEALQAVSAYRMLLYGALLTLMMVYKPDGIWGIAKRERNAIRRGLKTSDAA